MIFRFSVWPFIAKALGYQEAQDVEDGRLVVFGDGVWFYSWRAAVLNHIWVNYLRPPH